MGRRQKSASKAKNRKLKRGTRDLKRRTPDQDQAHKAVLLHASSEASPPPVDEELPGGGQHVCCACSRYFINEETLKKHCTTKAHKRRQAAALESPWSSHQAELAGR
ncbi:hypothetical protein Efla_006183 [Eimeria flavescens]